MFAAGKMTDRQFHDAVLKENFAQVFKPPGRGINNTSDTALYPDPVAELWRRCG